MTYSQKKKNIETTEC